MTNKSIRAVALGGLASETGAFELVDYLFYLYALWVFLSTAMSATSFSGEADVSIAFWLVALTFLLVLVRNYMVMHGIDQFRYSRSERLWFLDGLGRTGKHTEKFVRFLIIFAVIVTPKNLFSFASAPISSLADKLASEVFESDWWGAGISNEDRQRHHLLDDNLSYYAVVLLILMTLFVLWDLVVVFSMRSRARAKIVSTRVIPADPSIPDPAFRAYMRYLCLCKPRECDGGGDPTKVSFVLFDVYSERNRRWLSKGKLILLYLFSPKFGERLFGAAVALSLPLVAASDFGGSAVGLLVLLIVLYFIFATRNERYFSSIMEFLGIGLTFFFGRNLWQRSKAWAKRIYARAVERGSRVAIFLWRRYVALATPRKSTP